MDKENKEVSFWNKELNNLKNSERFIWGYSDKSSYEKGRYVGVLGEDYADKLNTICRSNKLLIYTFLVSALKVTLSKYTIDKNITVGIPSYSEKNNPIINKLLPLTSYIDYESTYLDYMTSIKSKVLECYKNQVYLNSKILLKNNLPNNLMEILPINICMKGLHKDNQIDYICSSNKNQLAFLFELIQDKSINIDIIYNSDKIAEITAKNIYESYITVLKDVLHNYNKRIKDIKILSEEDINKILFEFNDTKADYPKDKTIQELFEAQVENTPDNIAVVFENKKLTYRELNEKSNSLARLLRAKGVKSDSIVGIILERSLEMIIGVMGILKAGGAYLPIDSNYPRYRIEYMLRDSEVKVVLSRDTLVENIEFVGDIIDLFNDDIFSDEPNNPQKINNSNNLAYVIYTSGTTGQPKGTMIEHGALVNRLNWMQKKYPLTEEDSILQKTTYTFDVSVWELLWWSIVGAKVCMLGPNDEKDPIKIIEAINKYSITTMHFVPSMLDVFLYCVEENENSLNLPSLRQVFSSGEALNFKQVSKFYERFTTGKRLINLYGPTEATIDVTYFDCNKNYIKTIPIGKPIDNIKLYILNNNEIVPIGMQGELCIAGEGLARGYLNKPKLTEEMFIDNPFEEGTKMYKTGDLARWLPDGNIEFLGRIDNQVKIRGFRIELSEIENRLLQHDNIKEATVVIKENKDNEKYICAYVVSENDINELNIKNHLKKNLPEYMIPNYFMRLDNMPLTSNGKLNKRLLPEIDSIMHSEIEYIPPKNQVEEKLVQIWKDILKIKQNISIKKSFFEVGGHSLKASMLAAKILKEFNIEIPLSEIFKRTSIEEQAEYINNANKIKYKTIETTNKRQYYQVSSQQKRLYGINMLEENNLYYNMPCIVKFEGEIDKSKFEYAIYELVKRHESLRTGFQIIEGEIVQRIYECVDLSIEYLGADESRIDENINKFIRPFNLNSKSLLRIGLITIKKDFHILMFDMHHIISDGTSIGILLYEFTKLYSGGKLKKLPIQYKDYATWQKNMINSEEMKKQKEYWLNKFSGEIPVLNMPTDYSRPAVQSFEGACVSFIINKELTAKFYNIARKYNATLYMILLAAYTTLLYKYTGQEEIVVGTAIAGRNHTDLENIIGVFVNTLAMKNNPTERKSFEELLIEVKENALGAYQNQDYQFEQLVESINIKRDISRNPLFDTMFILQNVDIHKKSLERLKMSKYNYNVITSKMDIITVASECENGLNIEINYCTKLFKEDTIKRFAEHFEILLEAVTENIKVKIKDINILTQNEKKKLLNDFNNTVVEYDKEKTIYELFEEQVDKTPESIALIFKDNQMSYKVLNQKCNSFANVLRKKGVKSNQPVAIMIERSLEMIVGIIGVLKSGAPYIPIDQSYPKDRVQYMLKDSGTDTLITSKKVLEGFKELDFKGQVIDIFDPDLYSTDTENLKKANKEEDMAYIIYTSGSTGNPKGVIIEHRNFGNLNKGIKERVKFADVKKSISLASISFDLSIFEILVPIINGVTIVIADEEDQKEPENLKKLIQNSSADMVSLTPSRLLALTNSGEDVSMFKNVSNLMIGGDIFPEKICGKIRNRVNTKIYNLYGPTEGTVWATMKELKDNNKVTIGTPLANTEIHIVGKSNIVQPIGVPGELCISGDSVARGYLNRKELTEEKFIENPYGNGKKIYKTGDSARWLSSGDIEFLGRMDNQVKIRGYRVELGEIENRLLAHNQIKEAVVVLKVNERLENYICAYITSKKNISTSELRHYLLKELPEYMIPSFFVRLDKMPLTPNGKISKKELPELDRNIVMGEEYIEPCNETEEELLKIWKEELKLKIKVGVTNDFFELGGDSLKALRIINKMRTKLNVDLSMKQFFMMSTIKEQAIYVANAEKIYLDDIKKVEIRDHYELSFNQKRLWIINQLNSNDTAYNIPVNLILDHEVNEENVRKAFLKIVDRHESFRTGFRVINDEPVQYIKEYIILPFETIDISSLDPEEKKIKEKIIIKEVSKIIFNLSEPPLFKIVLLKIEKEKYYLIVNMHHIISDGWSMEILKREFDYFYLGYMSNKEVNLEPLEIQYKDFTVWQNNLLKDSNFKEKAYAFWLKEIGEKIDPLNLPKDYIETHDIKQSSEYRFVLTSHIKDSLRKFSTDKKTTLFTVMFSIYNMLMARLSGQSNIICSIPNAGREQFLLKDIVGYFVNSVITINNINIEESFINTLNKFNEHILEVFKYQSYPLEIILDDLKIKYPEISVFFNMLSVFEDTAQKNLENLSEYHIQNVQSAKYDLVLYVAEYKNAIEMRCVYRNAVFNATTIEYFMNEYKKMIHFFIEDPNKSLKEYKNIGKKRVFKREK